jgi:hypothetical protein
MEPAFLRVSTFVQRALLIALGCALVGCERPQRAAQGPVANLDFASQASAPTPARDAGPASLAAEAGAAACEPPTEELAWLDCAGEWIELAHPVAFHPRRSIPPEPARSVLDAVAALLSQRRDVLLVRIEARGSRAAGNSAPALRRELDETQGRADAVLAYLWRRGGISAERLEAVGYGFDPRLAGAKERWNVAFRVVQRAEKVPGSPAVR